MTVTYVGDLSTDLDNVRFSIADTVEDSGPKPSGGNFTDEELTPLIAREGSWQRAVAACFDALEAEWTKYADISVGPRRESYSQIAVRYAVKAREWRKMHGLTAVKVMTTRTVRKDNYAGYTDDALDSDEYTPEFT